MSDEESNREWRGSSSMGRLPQVEPWACGINSGCILEVTRFSVRPRLGHVCVCVTVGRAFGDDMMFSVALDCFPLPIQVALVCIHVFQLVRLDWITDHWSAFAVRQPAVRGPSTTPTLAALLVHLENFWLIFAPCWHSFGGCGFIIGTLILVSGR